MKKIILLFAAALLYALTGMAHATPVFTKVTGASFDIYIEQSYYYSAAIEGNTVKLYMRDFYSDRVDQLQQISVMTIVAHQGKSIKSSYQQNFQGAFRFGEFGNADDAAFAALRSDLAAGTFDGQDFIYEKAVGAAEDMAIFSRDGNQTIAGFDSAAYGDLAGSFHRDSYHDGGRYTQLGLLFDYRVAIGKHYSSEGEPGIGLYEMSFAFDTADDPVAIAEPASMALFAAGAMALCLRRRRPLQGKRG